MASPLLETQRMTPEQAAHWSELDHVEVVDGDLQEKPMSFECGVVAAEVLALIRNHTRPGKLGIVTTHDTGLQIFQHLVDDPDRVRRPDGLYFSADNLPPRSEFIGYCHTVPRLVFEVVSPSDLAEDLAGKVFEYLGAGIDTVWVFYPRWKRVHVFRRDGSAAALSESDTLSGEPAIPGFSVTAGDCFPDLPTATA